MTTPEDEIKRLLLSAELDLLERLRDRTEQLDSRVGDDSSLRESTRAVIVDVLRDADVRDHDRLSRVMAPLVVSSMREEIRNSRDMMVDALYPITGRLVAAAVRNAIRELMETLNEKLDQSFSLERWKIRLQARATGRSEAELLLQRNPPFEIEDLLVIHRPTGLLIARARGDHGEQVPDGQGGHEQDGSEGIDSDLMGGMLTAIMSFVHDAMGEANGGDLEELGFGDSELFLRSSPAVILAVKATGTKPAGFEATLEAIFQAFLVRWGDRLRDFDGADDDQDKLAILGDLRERFAALLAAKKKNFRRRSYKAPIVLLLLLLVLLGWGGYLLFEAWRVEQLEAKARAVIGSQAELTGFPIEPRYDPESGILVIEGLFPNQEALEAAREGLARELPGAPIDLVVNLVSRGETERLSRQLGQLRDGLGGLERSLDQAMTAVQPQLDRLGEQASVLERSLDQAMTAVQPQLDRLGEQTSVLERSLDEAMTTVQPQLDHLGEQASTLERSLDEAITAVQPQLDRLGEQASELESATGDLEASIGDTASSSADRADQIGRRIENLGSETKQLESALSNAIKTIADQAVEVGERTEALERVTSRLDQSLQETARSAEARAVVLTQLITEFHDVTARLEQSITQMGASAEEQRSELAARLKGLEALSRRLGTAIEETKSAADGGLEAANARTGGLEAVVRQLQQRVAEAAGLIEAQGSEIAARTQDLKSATGRLKVSLQEAVEAAGLIDSRLEERVVGLDTDVSNIRRALGLLSSDLESVASGAKTKPIQHLTRWADRHAIFFKRDSEFVDEAQALRKLQELADLMGTMPGDVQLRIIGYADPIGTVQANREISLGRAERVAADLRGMGVAPDRLVTVGRSDQKALVGHGGEGSPNRRVEFEVVFFGDDKRADGNQ